MSSENISYRRFVASLFGTLKLMQMYGSHHDATREAVQHLADTINEAAGSGEETVLMLRGMRLQVNDRTMRASECGNLALSYLADEFGRRQIAAVHLRVDAGPEELAVFIREFLEISAEEEEPADALTARLFALGVQGIAIERREEDAEEPVPPEERRDSTMRAYLQGLRAFKEVLRDDGYPDRSKVRRARRAVQGLVDRFLEDEAAVLTLAQIRGFDVKLFHHCMNVSLYALAIGQRISLSRKQLGELGLAALFHDLGKTVPPGRKVDETDQDAAKREIMDHPTRGARMLLAESNNHAGMLKASIVAYEQHAHFDLTGHPPMPHDLHLFSRIVTIADCFDALTAQRSPGEPGHTAYEAFRMMQARAGTIFDPVLLKVFMNCLGIYPVGSVVVLTTGEIALVVGGPTEPQHIDKPKIRIVDKARGTLEKDTELDLGQSEIGIRDTLEAAEVFTSIGDLVAAV